MSFLTRIRNGTAWDYEIVRSIIATNKVDVWNVHLKLAPFTTRDTYFIRGHLDRCIKNEFED